MQVNMNVLSNFYVHNFLKCFYFLKFFQPKSYMFHKTAPPWIAIFFHWTKESHDFQKSRHLNNVFNCECIFQILNSLSKICFQIMSKCPILLKFVKQNYKHDYFSRLICIKQRVFFIFCFYFFCRSFAYCLVLKLQSSMSIVLEYYNEISTLFTNSEQCL